MTAFPDAVIAGIGETERSRPTLENDEEYHSVEEYLQRTATLTLDGTGFSKEDVDGVGIARPNHRESSRYVEMVAETLGFEDMDWFTVADHGGASASQLMVEAAMAIQLDLAETVLCLGAETSLVPGDEGPPLPAPIHGYEPNYMAPFGYQGPVSRVALIENRYEAEYDLDQEVLGKIAVTQRDHALRNPIAYQDEPLTVEEYLDSTPIADPVRLLDFVVPVNCGHGFLLTSRDNIDQMERPPVDIAGFGLVNINADTSERPDMTATGIGKASRKAFAMAEHDPADMDSYQLYDNFLISVVMQLEEVGVCEKGEGMAFVDRVDISYDGEYPVNTGGGQISGGQAGRMGGFVQFCEAIRQVTEEGGNRQVPDAETAVVTALGGLSYAKNYQQTNTFVFERGDY